MCWVGDEPQNFKIEDVITELLDQNSHTPQWEVMNEYVAMVKYGKGEGTRRKNFLQCHFIHYESQIYYCHV
jgi:hypothetical protein